MKVIYAWCKKVMKEGEEPVSHGQCPECMKIMEKEFKEYQEEVGKMKTIVISPTGINNFHNSTDLVVRVTGEIVKNGMEIWGEDLYIISKRQAKRIEKHFCGIVDCSCPAGGVVFQLSPDGDEFALKA